MPKKPNEQPEVVEKKPKEDKEKKPREKKDRYEGSRWSSLIVLILFVMIGLVLSLTSNH